MSALAPRAELAPVEDSFWQKPFVQDVLPFMASMVFHLCLIGLGLLTYRAVIIVTGGPTREPPLIPLAPTHIVTDGPISNIPFGFPDGTDTEAGAKHNLPIPPDEDGLGNRPSTGLARALTNPGGGSGNEDSTIAVGPSTGSFGKGDKGVGDGTGDGTGPGNGEMGLAPRSDRDKRPWGTETFRGRGFCTKVVFVCDASGSMVTKFDTLRLELRKAVDVLRPIQSFDVVFFAGDAYKALDTQLMLAVPENKRKAYEFLDQTSPSSSSDPIAGLRAAFAARPQLIFLLTDGDFPNNNQVVEEIRKLNPDHRVMINTIAFMDRGEEYEKILKQIAAENRGTFKFVSEVDLQR